MLVDDVTRKRHANEIGLRCVRLRKGREEGRREEAHLLAAYTQKPVSHICGNQGIDEEREHVIEDVGRQANPMSQTVTPNITRAMWARRRASV